MPWEAVRQRVTYANVVASLALFVALGGTSYALTLPRGSVGAKQIRTGAVGRAEVRTGAIRSPDIRNGGVALRDLSHAARTQLRGQQGPPGPPGQPAVSYYMEVNSAGEPRVGNGFVIATADINGRVIRFPRSVANCALAASLARVPGGVVEDPPPGSTVVAAHQGDDALVRTWDPNGAPRALPFTLIAAC